MAKIILTGGGTAGHVTPHLALIPELQREGKEVHYIGRRSGIERELLESVDVIYHAIATGKFRRYFSLQNVTDLFFVFAGLLQSLRLVLRIRPQLIFSKGGFVACPVVWAGWLLRIPVVIHESDLIPGLANRLSAPFATKICYSFPETKRYLSKDKSHLTGIPVRSSLLEGNRQAGVELCRFDGAKPVVLVMGGSLGSRTVNRIVRKALTDILKRFDVCHICGRGNTDPNLFDFTGYCQFEYVAEHLPHLLAMADIVVTRAGATTLFELLALGKPSLLIPLSRKASRGDQISNARSFEKRQFSLLLPEEDLTPRILTEKIERLFHKKEAITGKIAAAPTGSGSGSVFDVLKSMM